MIGSIIDILWPIWEESKDRTLDAHIAAITKANWKFDPDSCLEEARSLRNEQNSRNISAGIKSQIYIAALLGLIPVILSITQIDLFAGRLEVLDWSAVTGVIFFAIGIANGLFALHYALNVLKVTAFHCVDVIDLVNLSSTKDTKSNLITEILLSVRYDRSTVNRKVGFVKMTQSHIGRMVVMFLTSLFFLMIWPFFSAQAMELINSYCTCVQTYNL